MQPINTEAYLWVNERTGSRTLSFNPNVTAEQEKDGWTVYPMVVGGPAIPAEKAFTPGDLFQLPGSSQVYWVIYSPFVPMEKGDTDGFWKAMSTHPLTRGQYAVGVLPEEMDDKNPILSAGLPVVYMDVSQVHNMAVLVYVENHRRGVSDSITNIQM